MVVTPLYHALAAVDFPIDGIGSPSDVPARDSSVLGGSGKHK